MLRKFSIAAGCLLFIVSFSFSNVFAQESILGPYTPDSNTVILMHFDDSLTIESGANISAPPEAIPYAESDGVTVPDSSALPALGGSLHLNNLPSDVNADNDIYNFIAISHFEGGHYPKNPDNGLFYPINTDKWGTHYDAMQLADDFTIEAWVRIGGWHSDWMQLLTKPGEGISTTNNWQFDNYELRVRPNRSGPDAGNGFVDGGWHPADSSVNSNGCCWGNNLETGNVVQAGNWYKITMVKDRSQKYGLLMVHDVDGNLVDSYQRIHANDSLMISDTAQHNDIFVGWNPYWNIGPNYTPDELGDASGLGDLGFREFYGNIDELRISNSVRTYDDVGSFVALGAGSPDLINKPAVIPATKDSISFAIEIASYNTGNLDPTVNLHYNVGGSGWQTQEMNQVGPQRYEITRENFSGGNVSYYVSAEVGDDTFTYPEGASDGVNNLSFLVDFLDARVLKLSFENGTTPVMDSSSFDQTVTVVGDTTYNTLGFDGTWSYELGPNSDLALFNTPSVASGDIAVDLWFRPNEVPSDSSRLVAKEAEGDSSMVNYSIFFKDGELRGRASGAGDVELDTAVSPNTWYRVLYMVNKNAHSIQLWNAQGEMIAYDVEKTSGAPVRDNGPLFIGQGNLYPDSAFSGLVDGVEIHNYAAKTGPFVVENISEYISIPDTVADYQINANIYNSGGGELTARLHYQGQFGWTFLEMNQKDAETELYSKPITKQEAPKEIPYYLEIMTGPYSAEFPQGAGQSEDSTNFDFAVYETYAQVLDVNFEDFENGVPVDTSTYSEFHDFSIVVDGDQAPTFPNDAVEGKKSMHIQKQDTSYLSIDSKFLATDEITMTFAFKPTDFDPDLDGGWQYYRSIQIITKNNGGDILSFGSPHYADAYYSAAINNERYSDQPRTLVGRTMTENQIAMGNERAMHDGLDMDSTLQVGKWYKVHFEYAINDTAFTQLMDADGNIIEEVGMKTDDFGRMFKNDEPLTLGLHDLHGVQEPDFFGRSAHYDGHIDDVEIYNYAATQKPPQITGVTEMDTAVTGNAQTVEATVTRNGNEPVYLVWRTKTSYGTSAWDSTMMSVDFTGENYSADIPSQDAGTVVQYWVGTQNDFGTTSSSDMKWVPFYMQDMTKPTLILDFEEGSGDFQDKSDFGWRVKKAGKFASSPNYTKDAIKGEYALNFEAEDSTYIEIPAPYPFLNHKTFTVDMWVKHHREANTNVRLLSKPGTDADGLAWWQQNFEMKGIGGGSWTFGGYMADTTLDFGDRFIVNHLDDSTRFGSDQVKASLEDSTWYHYRYVQDLGNDSVHAAITTADGQTVVQTSFEIAGDMNLAPVFTSGPFQIGHAGPDSADTQPYFDGVIDHLRISRTIPADLSAPAGPGNDLPDKFSLGDNYPNPFNPTTTIEYALPKSTDVTLTVYNLLGREVATLVNSKQQAGRHQVQFDASSLASGVYFYRITTPEFNKVRKMMLIK